jgi:hypothetical protein
MLMAVRLSRPFQLLVTLFCFALWATTAQARVYPIAAGADTATVQRTIDTAAASLGGNTVSFAAGNYSLGSLLIHCPASPLVITGPETGYPSSWNDRPKAVITSIAGGGHTFNLAAPCNKKISILYLDVNGNRPGTGGGAIYLAQEGISNLTISYNYFHGNQLPYPKLSADGTYYDAFEVSATHIYLDGYTHGKTDTNITITYNIFGNPVAGDCSGVMQWTGGMLANPSDKYYGYDSTGGSCGALGVHINTINLIFEYNIIQQQEQPIKFYEGGKTPDEFFYQTGDHIQYNDFGFYHRIATEMQQSPTTKILPTVWSFNDVHDQVVPAYGNWALSAPQFDWTDQDDNVMISNTRSNNQAGPANFEYWGNGHNDHNLEQGYTACGTDFGFMNPKLGRTSVSYNVLELVDAKCSTTMANGTVIPGIQSEEGIPAEDYPIMIGNQFSRKPSSKKSPAPTISPESKSFSGSQQVTLIDKGNEKDPGPRGNIGIWYTTDGSNPGPKFGTSKFYTGPFTVSATTTVKAVGMWGAITQPASYPAGYGFVPSATVTAVYTRADGEAAHKPAARN